MARLVRFYRGGVTWRDYQDMPHRDLVALEKRMWEEVERASADQ